MLLLSWMFFYLYKRLASDFSNLFVLNSNLQKYIPYNKNSQSKSLFESASDASGNVFFSRTINKDILLLKLWTDGHASLDQSADGGSSWLGHRIVGSRLISSGDFGDIINTGIYYVANAVTNKPTSIGGFYVLASAYNDGKTHVGLYVENAIAGGIYKVTCSSGKATITKLM